MSVGRHFLFTLQNGAYAVSFQTLEKGRHENNVTCLCSQTRVIISKQLAPSLTETSGSVVVEALGYNPEGCGFKTQ
jgi:hypothetical protein